MSYLKIFPRSIVVKMDREGGYIGRMNYDYEQYGRMICGDDLDVELLFLCAASSAGWVIRSVKQKKSLAGFSIFMSALNKYMFDVLQFDPVSQWSKISTGDYEYYFERVYFDLGTRQFNRIANGGI